MTSEVKAAPLVGEVVADRGNAFGAVLSNILIRSASEARLLRRVLNAALDEAVSDSSASSLNRWLDQIDDTMTRASKEAWIGWESVHAPR